MDQNEAEMPKTDVTPEEGAEETTTPDMPAEEGEDTEEAEVTPADDEVEADKE